MAIRAFRKDYIVYIAKRLVILLQILPKKKSIFGCAIGGAFLRFVDLSIMMATHVSQWLRRTHGPFNWNSLAIISILYHFCREIV
jgi:hypothetical protein